MGFVASFQYPGVSIACSFVWVAELVLPLDSISGDYPSTAIFSSKEFVATFQYPEVSIAYNNFVSLAIPSF